MAKLTKYEKETIVLFNEGEDTAHIQTYNEMCIRDRPRNGRFRKNRQIP